MPGCCLPCDVQVRHTGAWWADPKLLEKPLYFLPRPFYLGDHATVRKISHPSPEPQFERSFSCEGAITDPLNSPGHDDLRRDEF